MAIHAPIMGKTARAPLLPSFMLANRAAIEQEIERLIALLDASDGDPDLEDCDPAGDPLDELGEEPGSCGRELLRVLPRYGIDQSLGPINEREGLRERQCRIMAG